jgi:hypothetical protein
VKRLALLLALVFAVIALATPVAQTRATCVSTATYLSNATEASKKVKRSLVYYRADLFATATIEIEDALDLVRYGPIPCKRRYQRHRSFHLNQIKQAIDAGWDGNLDAEIRWLEAAQRWTDRLLALT